MEEPPYSPWLLERVATGDVVRLRIGKTTIGRSMGATIRTNPKSVFVSRNHAVITISNEGNIFIQDIKSSNGVYINKDLCRKDTKELKAGDLIGMGVDIKDETKESLKHYVYLVKYIPIKQSDTKEDIKEVVEKHDVCTPPMICSHVHSSVPLSPSPSPSPPQVSEQYNRKRKKYPPLLIGAMITLSSDEDDNCVEKKQYYSIEESKAIENQNLESTVTSDKPKAIDVNSIAHDNETHKTVMPNILHAPLVSSVKKEHIKNVVSDIENIFGAPDDIIFDRMKEAKPSLFPYMYNNASTKPKISDERNLLVDGALVTIDSDDDIAVTDKNITALPIKHSACERNDIVISKSPNIFDTSSDSKDCDLPNEIADKLQQDADEEAEDIMFSQMILNDMKNDIEMDELGNSQISEDNNLGAVEENMLPIKKEPIDENMPSTSAQARAAAAVNNNNSSLCWIISDDEDYDEELERKTSGWSNKLFSQTYSNAMSQVFELDDELVQDIDDIIKEAGDIDIYNNENNAEDDYNDNDYYNREPTEEEQIVEEAFAKLKANIGNSTPDRIEENDDMGEVNSSPLVRQRRSLKSIPMLSSDSESEDDHNRNMKPVKSCKIMLNRLPSIEENNLTTSLKRDQLTKTADKNLTLSKTEEQKKLVERTKTESDQTEISTDKGNNSKTNLAKEKNDKRQVTERKKSASVHDVAMDVDHHDQSKINHEKKLHHKPETETRDEEKKILDNKKLMCEPSTSKPTTSSKLNKAKPYPPIIDAPQLPKHKGKLRGVSAAENCRNEQTKKSKNISGKTQQDGRTWIEKPGIEKEHEKERLKTIKIDRNKRLQELAEKNHLAEKKAPLKRKSCDENIDSAKYVKVTTVNRGAFLMKETPTAPNKSANVKKITQNQTSNSSTNSKSEIKSFDIEMSKINEFKEKHVMKSSNHKNIVKPISKDAINARAQRTTNKITFASMQKNMTDSLENHMKLQKLSNNRSCLTNSKEREANTTIKQKKTVRFKEKPIVYEIERIRSGPLRKVNAKDVAITRITRLDDRRNRVRNQYPSLDHTDDFITRILMWSNDWLVTRNADATAAFERDALPMPTHFISHEQYKSILLPLLKMEFITSLQRDFKSNANATVYKVDLKYATVQKSRLMLITKLHCPQGSPWSGTRYDLVLLDFVNFKYQNTFAYLAINRKESNSYTLVLEIPIEICTKDELLKNVKNLYVRPVIDNLRLAIGPYNAIEQLVSTPLFNIILNPLELRRLKKPLPLRINKYKGCDQMNDNQRNIILSTYQTLVDESVPSITLIQGPPGTGKSRLITNLALQTLYGELRPILNYRILICSQSNNAIDVIAQKLAHIKTLMKREEIRFRVIRFGMFDKMKPDVAKTISLQKIIEVHQIRKLRAGNPNITFQNKESLMQQIDQLKAEINELELQNIANTVQEDELIQKQKHLTLMQNIAYGVVRPEDERVYNKRFLRQANIVCTTLSSCIKLEQYVDYFDMCIIDEATQCTEPWTLVPLRFGINSLVLVGDAMQLPATVLSKKACDLGLRTSLFTRILRCMESQKQQSTNGVFYTLNTQYRMHPDICRWPNSYFYKNELTNDPMTLEYKSDIVPFSVLNLAYSQNDNCDKGKYVNDMEAEFVVKLIKALDPYLPTKENSYGVITPYALHRDTLSKAIKTAGIPNIMINTIDSYQGLEKDVILISNGRTRGIGFLSNYQRLNVALTRPRKCLILCGNFSNLESVPAWRSLLTNARERGVYHEISVNCVNDMNANVINKLKVKV